MMDKYGSLFLAVPNNLALIFNFKHTPYIVGVVYLVITNLPRSVRLKKESVILVALLLNCNCT